MEIKELPTVLEKLQTWYNSNCDGDWEHQYGFSLENIDNPGWTLTIDLDFTHQEDEIFSEYTIGKDQPLNWIVVKKNGKKLNGACGPMQLEQMLELVTDWLRPHTPELMENNDTEA
jgi:hypothetical protein